MKISSNSSRSMMREVRAPIDGKSRGRARRSLACSLKAVWPMLGLAVALSFGAVADVCAQEAVPPMKKITNNSAEWIPLYGEKWWNYYHADFEGFFPGGRSNILHDLYLAKVRRNTALTVDWQIFGRDYTFDGEWFAVEWFYRATNVADGFQQWESTLGVGRLKDGKMVLWTEYFDDSVGALQQLGLLPFYRKDEPKFPWPEGAKLSLPYRP